MRGKKNSSENSVSVGNLVQPATGITSENYGVRAKAFIAAREGSSFVIRAIEGQKGSEITREPATEPQWVAWMRYFEHKGIRAVFAVFHGLCTVPAEWPEDFDAEAGIRDRQALIPRKPSRYLDFDFGRRTLGMSADLARKLEAIGRPAPRRKNHPVMAEDALREYGAQPLTVGSALRAKLAVVYGRNEFEDGRL